MLRLFELSILTLSAVLLGLVLAPCAGAVTVDACEEPCCIEAGELESCALTVTGKGFREQAVVPEMKCLSGVDLVPPPVIVEEPVSDRSLSSQGSIPLRI